MFRKLYPLVPSRLKKKYLYTLIKLEGGEHQSKTYRNILADHYRIFLGKGSYGVIANLFPNNWGTGAAVKIGNYCSISSNVKRFNTNHPYTWSTMSPIFYKSILSPDKPDLLRHDLEIGHDVWIGSGVILLPGCQKIGQGAVIGAGSIVTKDIPPYTIWGGAPARNIGTRFDIKVIEALERSQWWDLSIEQLLKYERYVKNPLEFSSQITSAPKDRDYND